MRAFLSLSSPFCRRVNWGHKESYNLVKVTQQQAAGMRFSLSLPNCRVRMFSILLPTAQCPWICHYLWNSPFITGKWMNGVGVTDSGIQGLPYLLPWYTWCGFNLAVQLLSRSSLTWILWILKMSCLCAFVKAISYPEIPGLPGPVRILPVPRALPGPEPERDPFNMWLPCTSQLPSRL